MRRTLFGLLLITDVFTPCLSQRVHAHDKATFGWVERVYISEAGFAMHAKLDTGADSSSVHATNIVEFSKDDESWVRFRIRSYQGESKTLEAPVERVALIKRHRGDSQRRLVVRFGLCLGGIFQEEEVNLVNRGRFDYRFLLGRSFLVGNAIVDPALVITTPPRCPLDTSKIDLQTPAVPTATSENGAKDVVEKNKVHRN